MPTAVSLQPLHPDPLLAEVSPPPRVFPPRVKLWPREVPSWELWWPGPGTKAHRAAQGLPGVLRQPSWFSGFVLQLDLERCGQFNGLCQRPSGSELAATLLSSEGLMPPPPIWMSTCSLIAESVWSHRLLVTTAGTGWHPLPKVPGLQGTGEVKGSDNLCPQCSQEAAVLSMGTWKCLAIQGTSR